MSARSANSNPVAGFVFVAQASEQTVEEPTPIHLKI
jgi:hypothetical protein